jgi:hypothetical protein
MHRNVTTPDGGENDTDAVTKRTSSTFAGNTTCQKYDS